MSEMRTKLAFYLEKKTRNHPFGSEGDTSFRPRSRAEREFFGWEEREVMWEHLGAGKGREEVMTVKQFCVFSREFHLRFRGFLRVFLGRDLMLRDFNMVSMSHASVLYFL